MWFWTFTLLGCAFAVGLMALGLFGGTIPGH